MYSASEQNYSNSVSGRQYYSSYLVCFLLESSINYGNFITIQEIARAILHAITD